MRVKAKTNLEKMGFVDPDRKESKHDFFQIQILENPEKLIRQITENELKDLKIESVKLEHPVVTSTNFIVGYIDCVITFSFDEGHFYEQEKWETIDGEYQKIIKQFKRLTYGTICVEIKTKIDSFGDVIRQVNTYKQYLANIRNPSPESIFVIASEDDRYKKQFETQNIKFYKM